MSEFQWRCDDDDDLLQILSFFSPTEQQIKDDPGLLLAKELRRRTKRTRFFYNDKPRRSKAELNARKYYKELARAQRLQNRREKSKMLLSGKFSQLGRRRYGTRFKIKRVTRFVVKGPNQFTHYHPRCREEGEGRWTINVFQTLLLFVLFDSPNSPSFNPELGPLYKESRYLVFSHVHFSLCPSPSYERSVGDTSCARVLQTFSVFGSFLFCNHSWLLS